MLTVNPPELASVIDALEDGDAAPLREHLAELGVDVEAVRALPRWNAGASESGVPAQRTAPPQLHPALPEVGHGVASGVARVLDAALTAATPSAAGAALLAVYVWHECEQAWEISYHFEPIWQTLRGVAELWPRHSPDVPGRPDEAAMQAALCLLRLLDQEILAENNQTCGLLGRQATAAGTVVAQADAALAAADECASTYPAISRFLTRHARARARYYSALGAAAEAAVAALSGSAAQLTVAMHALAAAENDELLEDNDRSELRAHRFSLQALAGSMDQEWITIEHGKIVYIYPFGLRGIGAGEAVARVRESGSGWRPAGIEPTAVNATLDLDDIWAGSDFLGRRFEGAALVLPDIQLYDVDGVRIGGLTGELRLSDLGNHYLRLETDVDDIGPHELAFAIFRAAPEHGLMRVEVGGAGSWPRLSEFAVGLVRALPEQLGRAGEQIQVSVRPGMYHVLVTVHEASLGTGPAAVAAQRRQARTGAEVTAAVGGAVLLHPALNAVATVVEWIRYPAGAAQLVAGVGRDGDLVARTCNTTLLVMLGSPSWLIGMHETVAEFVASLDGLFGAWFDELASHHRAVMSLLGRMEEKNQALARITADAEDLRSQQLRLHDFVSNARSVQALIRSPALVASPLDAATMARLLDSAGYARIEADFEAKVRELLDDRLGTRLEALADRRRREAERRNRARVDTLLAMIAAAGISGVVQIVQAGLHWGAGEAVAAAVLIVAVAAGIGLLVRMSARDKAR